MTLEITFGAFLVAALWEFCRPRRDPEFPLWRRRFANLGIWLANIIAGALIFTSPDSLRLGWEVTPLSFVAGFVALDALSYWLHRAQHAVPWLWRLHALHHSDPDVDWTTSVRHHPAEFLSASGVFWLAVLVLRIPAAVVAAHGTTVFVLAVATHVNVQWPEWLERMVRPTVITLDLHLVHHSIAPAEANANFGAVFSFWDRLFGTFRAAGGTELVFGVRELQRRDCIRPIAMLLTPWRIQ
jgi:sterol desaturase/sphingolipid hydroxylase (fatty acid hydroxylase superfamily)